MATLYQRGTVPLPQTQQPGPCMTCTTTCPACGGLECLCRPRFFAGQLLTEDDLNLLERYVVEKNKLHNRYLVGWGVVCGLEVVCNPCQGVVTVRPGYALSPCGEDIVVCRDEHVDICALIRQCTNERPNWNCAPYAGTTVNDMGCQDLEEDWILTVRYDEKASRGITALRGASGGSNCSKCSGGGSSACGCGSKPSSGCGCGGRSKPGCTCGQQTSGSGTACSPARSPLPQCEPTVICEGYVFELCKVPARNPRGNYSRDPGALVDRFSACFLAFQDSIPPLPNGGQNVTPQQLYQWCCATKAALLTYFSAYGTYDCAWMTRLAAFVCPAPTANQPADEYLKNFQSAPGQLAAIAAEGIRYCLCSSLLPPCPDPVCDPRVPIATITVRASDCSILRVCDWGGRKIAITLPTLEYWLSMVPVFQQIRDLLTTMCCGNFQQRNLDVALTATAVPLIAQPMPGAVHQSASSDFTALFMDALANTTKTVDAETVFMGVLGAMDSQAQPFTNPTEMANPLQFMILNQVVAPALRAVLPQTVTPSTTGVTGVAPDMTALNARLEAMQQKIDDLEARVQGNG